jgi:HD superfamily phosphohydrolase YqeK
MDQNNHRLLSACRVWYKKYYRSFLSGDVQLEDAIKLKYDHTMRVGEEIEHLCDSISLDGNMRLCALLAALLHDVARFEQFREFRTFSDSRSIDHAMMALGVITGQKVLAGLKGDDEQKVLTAIRYHNCAILPEEINGDYRLLCKLLRDADKLDIYRIALDYYINPDPRRHEDGEKVTPEVVESVLRREFVPYEKIRSVTDFKMIQAGWVFDVNFPYSFKCLKQRGYISDIRRQLPVTPLIERAFSEIEKYLEEGAQKAVDDL